MSGCAASIDVLIPCAGNAGFFKESLHSALNQTLPPSAIYVIDNGCGHERYRSIVEQADSPLVHYVKHQHRLRITPNWQRCLSHGQSQLIAFLHDDDLWDVRYLETAVSALDKSAALSVLMPHAHFGHEGPVPLECAQERNRQLNRYSEVLRDFFLCTSNACHMSALVFRRAAIGFSPHSHWNADQSFLLSLVAAGPLVLSNTSGAGIRYHAEQITAEFLNTGYYSSETLLHLKNVLGVFVRDKGLSFSEFQALVPSLSAGHLLRLCQACFSLPRWLPAVEFGTAILASPEARRKLRSEGLKTSAASWCPAFLWPLLTVAQDSVYLRRDRRAKGRES